MLELWYRSTRTMLDFRRGPLGPHFDGFAAYLKQKGYRKGRATTILGKCCSFNNYLIEKGVARCKQITPSLIEPFLDAHFLDFRTTSLSYDPKITTRGNLKKLFAYLIEAGVIKHEKPKIKRKRYSWILEPYIKHLRDELEFTEATLNSARAQLCPFLKGLGEKTTRRDMKALKPEIIEAYMKDHINVTPENLRRLVGTLRRFLRFCARKGYISKDLSGLVPSIPSYRLATLPKGMEESALQRILNAIDKDTLKGARDYAILLLMMAYGMRAKQVAKLLLEDICWDRSTIRIRPLKGGKEVMLPLLESVGNAVIQYYRNRPENKFREIFLSNSTPFTPLSNSAISQVTRQYMEKAGVKKPGSGAHTMRHSWAVRALAQDFPIKAIADVLGHRCINTTFIYTKADLKTLRQVTMPWPEGR